MKKYISLILALLCVFLFSACSDKAVTFDVEGASKLNIKSPFGEVTITDNAFIRSIAENINSLDYEKNSATDEEESYIYLLTWLDTNGSQIARVAITDENGSQISYNGYYYNVGADRCIDVEAINNKIMKHYSSSLITDYEVIFPETDN